MDALKFTLSGETAFFKKPDVNSYYYFSYGNIHKIALLGILGSIIGLGGYNQQGRAEKIYPEFYEKLKNIKISIVPKNLKGYIPKKIQVFNNSIGYASQEKGGNLIIKEQWLEKPKWDIYILLAGETEEELAHKILSNETKYIPYLGKNDHYANILDVEIKRNIIKKNKPDKIDSLFIKDCFKFRNIEHSIDEIFDDEKPKEEIFKYEERLPITLEENTNKYQLESFIFTNSQLISKTETLTYEFGDDYIFFF